MAYLGPTVKNSVRRLQEGSFLNKMTPLGESSTARQSSMMEFYQNDDRFLLLRKIYEYLTEPNIPDNT